MILFGLLLLTVVDRSLCGENEANFILTTKTANISLNANSENLKQINFDLPTKFLIHGWQEDSNLNFYVQIAQEYLKRGGSNVIRVDYANTTKLDYIRAAANVKSVGKIVGELLVNLNKTYKYPMAKVHLVGHSLGGHVAGSAGRTVLSATNYKVGRISGLDVARPLFEGILIPKDAKLTKDDAVMVDIIHTDAGEFGYKYSEGTVDFFPNGGKRLQPGCTSETTGLIPIDELLKYFLFADDHCSHSTSNIYFTQSINREYLATKCGSWEDFKDGKCDGNEKVPFGEDTPPTARGNFYLYIDNEQQASNTTA